MELLLAILAGSLVAAGSYLMMSGKTLPYLFGLTMISNAANLIIFASGRLTFGKPPLVPEHDKTIAEVSNALPQALILTGIALGSALPVILPGGVALMASATIFGLCVFMPPGAVTSFSRQNLAPESWGAAIGLFTVVFAVAQTIGPYAAGLIGDLFGDLGISLLAAAAILLGGAGFSLMQRPLEETGA